MSYTINNDFFVSNATNNISNNKSTKNSDDNKDFLSVLKDKVENKNPDNSKKESNKSDKTETKDTKVDDKSKTEGQEVSKDEVNEELLVSLLVQTQQVLPINPKEIFISTALMQNANVNLNDGAQKNVALELVSAEDIGLDLEGLGLENVKGLKFSNLSNEEQMLNQNNQNQNGQVASSVQSDVDLVSTKEVDTEVSKLIKNLANSSETKAEIETEMPDVLVNQPQAKDIKDLEVFSVKVGDTNTDFTNENVKNNFADQIGEKIVANITDNVKEFVVSLNPVDLGEINIKISFENGNANVIMKCISDTTTSLLSEKASMIGAMVENSTGHNTNVVVEQQEASSNNNDTENNSNKNGHNQKENQNGNKNDENNVINYEELMQKAISEISFRNGVF